MAPCSPARVVGLTAQALLGLALALNNPAARAAEQPPEAVAVSISRTKLTTPVFDGEPKLEPIAGTSIKYIVNSATPIILVGTMNQRYYAMENARLVQGREPARTVGRRSQRARGDLHDPDGLAASLRHLREDLRRRGRHGLRRLCAALRNHGETAMKVLRGIEILTWCVGVSLLVVYASTRAWFTNRSEHDIATFEAATVLARTADPVDMTTWSRARVDRYRESLRESLAPQALLRIPSVKLVVPVFEGTSELNLNRGAGRIEGTARIGEAGNVGIAAHRDGFFRVLKDVQVGDTLLLERLDWNGHLSNRLDDHRRSFRGERARPHGDSAP